MNTLLTPTYITKEAVMQFTNNLVMFKHVNTEHQSEFKKKGDSITIRTPVYYEAVSGSALGAVQAADEGSRILTIDQRFHVPMSFSTKDLTLTIEDFSKRYIQPAMTELAQKVELQIAQVYKSAYNYVGTPGTLPSTALAVGAVTDFMDDLGIPDNGQRVMIYEPQAMTAIAAVITTVFPTGIATKAIEKGTVINYMNLTLDRSVSLPVHTVGALGGVPLVNGANQSTTHLASRTTGTMTLNTDGWTNSVTNVLLEGDIFTIAGVYSVNRRTRLSTGRLQTFVVRANVNSGALTGPAALTIAPAIITTGAYQTVTAAPANNAAITVKGTAGAGYRQNMGWHKNAITVAVAPLDTNTPGAQTSSASENGISLRTTAQYSINSDDVTYRIDVLFGVKVQNEGFLVRQTS